ncbi:DUF192 domain-containing protein [Candidatus Formimonas warabiya]|uniref:DUF192 domain-containing protein n=1 Tax=Formimonas warabiya TaxID=1761012 RepID=A0A3G1L2F0_FORW1|nr:DUF192 domain-containing protein [Candidatus Formimonas warabiya]ATW28645.1 hypothetical protein DCMF_15665 [Candidatus Formimonas warabiya]
MKVIKKDGHILIADRVMVAQTFWRRLIGLLGRKGLGEREGLLLRPCAGVHCMGMRFPIDAVFLDKNNRVIKTANHLAPGFTACQKGAVAVLELKAGLMKEKNIALGDRLIFIE